MILVLSTKMVDGTDMTLKANVTLKGYWNGMSLQSLL